MIGTALAIGSTLASLFGSIKSAEANKETDEQLAGRRSKLDSWYNKEYNTNYLDTDEAKSALQVLQTQMKERQKAVSQGNAINGASDETRVATNDKLQRGYADAVTRLAGRGTQYKNAIRSQYMGYDYALGNQETQNLQNKSANWTNFMGNAANAAGGFIQADADGAFDKWDGSLSKWNASRKSKKAVTN